MKKLISMFLLGTLAICINGCKEVDEPYVITCADGLLEWEEIPRFYFNVQNLGFDPYLQENWSKRVDLIINSDLELYHYIKVDGGYPKIDFKRKSLLIARVGNNLEYLSKQSITIDCKANRILWVRDAEQPWNGNDTQSSILFSVLVPKVNDKTTLVFDVNLVK